MCEDIEAPVIDSIEQKSRPLIDVILPPPQKKKAVFRRRSFSWWLKAFKFKSRNLLIPRACLSKL
jgi:hypothetical protein